MGSFSIISDVSSSILKTIRASLCPEPVQSPESIQLASPVDKKADFMLGLFLYDINGQDEVRTSAQIREAESRRFPPKPLSLSYVLYLNSKAQIAAGAEAEQRILGRCLQTLYDYPVVDIAAAHPFEGPADAAAAVTLLNLSFEDKSKLWSCMSIPYQTGIYFTVSPVLITSTRKQSFSRVRETDISLAHKP